MVFVVAHQVVAWLWETVAALEPEEQRKFLKFVSGSDRAPIGGLANLRCTIQVVEAGSSSPSPIYVVSFFLGWCQQDHPASEHKHSRQRRVLRIRRAGLQQLTHALTVAA